MMFASQPTQKSDSLYFHFVLFGDVFPSVWAEKVSHGTKTAWKLTFSYESAYDDYQEKKSSTELNLILVTPSLEEIRVKTCSFG